MSIRLVFKILVTIILLSGCGARKGLAPVVGHDQPPGTKVRYHTVSRGETLYSIAWRYNLDYKRLAKSNNIGSEYKIYPGQKIHLSYRSAHRSSDVQVAKSSKPESKSKDKTSTQVSSKVDATRLKNKPLVVKKSPPSDSKFEKLRWSWPANGAILSRFNSKQGLNKGIDIAGELGEPVRAAASGRVVYSGEGLRGYGKLIIIKHSEKYLSAYAHNQALLVSEGDAVVRNEKIATMGETGTDEIKLHFEIRYDGKPVDPLAYLPPRK